MKRFRHRASQLLVLVVPLNLVIFWGALRLVGWPLVNGRSSYTPITDWPQLPPGLVWGQVTKMSGCRIVPGF